MPEKSDFGAVVDAYLRLNMLDIASNSRPPTTNTNGPTSATPNNQVAVAITPHLCPTDEPRELLGPLPIPSQPLPKPNCSTSRRRFVLSTVTTCKRSSPSRTNVAPECAGQ